LSPSRSWECVTNSAKGCKGGKRCSIGRTTIHRSVDEHKVSHKGANNGRNIAKANGNGAM